MRSCGFLLAISFLSSCVFGADWNSVFNDAKSFGKQTAEDQQSVVRNPNPQEVPFYTDKPPHAGAWGVTDFVGPATKHIGECSAGKGATPQDRKECEAVVFLAKEIQDRPHVEVRPDDPLIEGGKDIIDNATGGNTGGECVLKPGGSTINKEEWCEAGRDKRVGACSRTLEMRCENGTNCADSGIASGGISLSDGSYSYSVSGSTLQFANYIHVKYKRTFAHAKFNIINAENMKTFALKYVHSDNWVGVEVNGKWVGTHSRYFGGLNQGSDRLELTGRGVQYSPTGFGPGETGNDFASSMWVDLRPLLRDGENTISIYVINGGGGGLGIVQFDVFHYCPCEEIWHDDCAGV